MSHLHPLLIELGTEELPVKALPILAQALFDGVIQGLQERHIEFSVGDAKPLYTPRRLAVLLPEVAEQQPDQSLEVLGPYSSIGLDSQGEPTKALLGFAQKNGVEWSQLDRITDSKGERFVYRHTKAGANTADLLPEILQQAMAAMPIPKPMRWGNHSYSFARPVHWLVMLLGKQVIKTELFGIESGYMSRGHRFMHNTEIWISHPSDYKDALRSAFVLVDADERRQSIMEEVQQAAASIEGLAQISEDNLQQVVCLTEWPSAVLCSFDPEFLVVPQEALIETMEVNQKFFSIFDKKHQLTPYFVGVANIHSKNIAEVRKGYERVIRPRFADAKFFFDEDLKQGLAAMGDGLKNVLYQAKLGSIADKTQRVAVLAETIAQELSMDTAWVRQAALLSKNDLQSRMVNEFPELQGIAGRHYALAAGEPEIIANAIDQAYQPRFAGDAIAPSKVGQVLAIAERLDTIAGGFIVGLKPTGNKDPFALRRCALGLARTIIEGKFECDLISLLEMAFTNASLFVAKHHPEIAFSRKSTPNLTANAMREAGLGLIPSDTSNDVLDAYSFILDRLRAYYSEQAAPASHFNAVAELRPISLLDFDYRLRAIGAFSLLADAEALAAANKRIRNILRKSDVAIDEMVNPNLLQEPAEIALAFAMENVIKTIQPALQQQQYQLVLEQLAKLRPAVDAFFDHVMVNAEDQALRNNRLSLLQRLSQQLGIVAAIEHLAH